MIDNALKINGWMSPSELEWLAVMATTCNKIIELGSYHGRSTRALADNCSGVVYAIDHWNGPYYTNKNTLLLTLTDDDYNKFRANIDFPPTKAAVVSIRIPYTTRLSDLELPKIDLLFIDADHRYEYVMRDIEDAKRLVCSHGIICGHDYTHKDWPGVKQAVDEVYPHASKIDSIWWTFNEGE